LPEKPIDRIFEEQKGVLLAIPHVMAVALGRQKGNPCVLVFVDSRDPKLRKTILRLLEGVPVIIKYSGPVRAL